MNRLNEQLNYFNRPVVDVTWFEAMAYCRWLDKRIKKMHALPLPQGNYSIRLPTVAEWKEAAYYSLDEKCFYPWGYEDWDQGRANISDSEIGHPTSVGMYPQGATRSELYDLSGNVWEWTLSRGLYCKFNPVAPAAPPQSWYFLYGGSWYVDKWDALLSSRIMLCPGAFNSYSGFRVVLSLANAERL